jgi:hypothetical protein
LQGKGLEAVGNRYNDYAIIEIGHEHWILVQVLRVTSTPAAAWRVLGHHRRRCVVETDDGEWAACLLSAVLADRQDGRELLARIPDAVLLFESCAPNPMLDAAYCAALQKLFACNKVRFERNHTGDEQWFAL